MKKDLFPLAIAKGSAFCDRQDEQQQLLDYINKSAHVVLIAPRRYGKSSLSRRVAERWANDKQKQLAVRISMLSAWNVDVVADKIIAGVSQALSKICPFMLAGDMKKLAASLHQIGFSLSLNLDGFSIGFSGIRKNTTDTLMGISNILTALDKQAENAGWKVMLEIDEFQEISRLSQNHAIEAEIREAIQQTSNISCVFLGSNRQMLEAMFIDKTRPFYHMCHIMRLHRIKPTHYHLHLEEASKVQWGKQIDADVIDVILQLTACHPHYVNKLCSELWNMDRVPNIKTTMAGWQTIIEEESSNIVEMMTNLSLTQKAVVSVLALRPEKSLGSKLFLDHVGLASSTVRTAIKQLKKDDIVYQDAQGNWCVMNPCLSSYLQQ